MLLLLLLLPLYLAYRAASNDDDDDHGDQEAHMRKNQTFRIGLAPTKKGETNFCGYASSPTSVRHFRRMLGEGHD